MQFKEFIQRKEKNPILHSPFSQMVEPFQISKIQLKTSATSSNLRKRTSEKNEPHKKEILVYPKINTPDLFWIALTTPEGIWDIIQEFKTSKATRRYILSNKSHKTSQKLNPIPVKTVIVPVIGPCLYITNEQITTDFKMSYNSHTTT